MILSLSSPPENLAKSVFKTPQSAAKKFIPPPTAGTTSVVSPKGANPSAVQSPVTPSNQQFKQIMEIVKSAGVPKDKPYYIILNQGLPNEQTFLIEPPESKEKGIINLFDSVREKNNNLGSDQVRHKMGCTVTEDG